MAEAIPSSSNDVENTMNDDERMNDRSIIITNNFSSLDVIQYFKINLLPIQIIHLIFSIVIMKIYPLGNFITRYAMVFSTASTDYYFKDFVNFNAIR